ncbi:MAG: hypothetical protein GC185_12300 [Alphaproteobacteria bacterium]|nr:hypothetical protein [Alphaproteobacteria bacterium]
MHGECERLAAIHRAIYDKFSPGDRLVYTGNYLGGEQAAPVETLDELLHFRRSLMALPGIHAEDIVYLRGIQEQIWSKLLQLQFAASGIQVVEWLAARHGDMDSILRAYGSSLEEAARIAREGTMSMTRWTGALKQNIRLHPGHEKFFTVLRRAAFTTDRHSNDNYLLFVNAGFNPLLTLENQGDHFWWSSRDFNDIEKPYAPFRAVIRGYDPDRHGVHIGNATISLDGGCGHGGQLVCARLSDQGDVQELLGA